MQSNLLCFASGLALLIMLPSIQALGQPEVSPEEARVIAKEAYIYGYPMVDSYRIQYAYFADRTSPEFKSGWNTLKSIPRVYTPDDRAVQTPNSDTPYSMIGLDLRAEPMVLTVPAIEKRRYYSIQLVDAYTFNFDYIGSRATGNGAGHFLVAGPSWQGSTPPGINKVIRCETERALGIYRTQLFDPEDLEAVKKIQSEYQVRPLSAFLGQSAPPVAPAMESVPPLSTAEQKTSPKFFDVLNFILQYCPIHPSEQAMRDRWTKLEIGPGRKFSTQPWSPVQLAAVEQGMADAWAEFAVLKKDIDAKKVVSGDLFGTREALSNNYLRRMAGAIIGIYGNSKWEAMYPIYSVDSQGQPLEGANRYQLRFAPSQLPPVNGFWSLTMYEMPASLLVANPLHRYLLNSSMMPQFKLDDDGGLTLWIQHESPGPDKESNWLPAPAGPFMMAMRLYWPKEEVVNGSWSAPALQFNKE